MNPSKKAIAWAEQMRFSVLTSAETIIEAHEAHQRLMVKVASRNRLRARPDCDISRARTGRADMTPTYAIPDATPTD